MVEKVVDKRRRAGEAGKSGGAERRELHHAALPKMFSLALSSPVNDLLVSDTPTLLLLTRN